MRGRAPSQGAHVQGVFEALLSVLHPRRITSVLQASAACLFFFLLLLLPMAYLRAASPDLALPGLKASPAAFYWVGVRGTLVHLLLVEPRETCRSSSPRCFWLQHSAGRVNVVILLLLLLASQPS